MKVLQITTNYPTTSNPAFGIFMKEQVDSLEKYGVENTIFFSNGSETGVGKKRGGMKVHLRSALRLMRHLLTHRYDLIHCHSGVSGLILACSMGIFFNKTVISFQNDPRLDDAPIFKKLYPLFNKVIVKIPVFLDRKKIVYLPNGCNTDFFKPISADECKRKLNLDPQKRYVLFVDSNTAKKRTQKRRDRFDKVMEILRTHYGHTDIEPLVMIGIKREQVPTYINASALHLLCSDLEGSPNSVKECMSCNVPVVATNVGNVEQLLDGVLESRVAETFEPEEIAAKVHEVLTYDGPHNGRQMIIDKKLDIDSVARQLLDIYKNTTA